MKFFTSKKPHYEFLRKKWISRHKEVSDNLVDKHLRHVALSGLGGLMLLTTPTLGIPHQLNQSHIGTLADVQKSTSGNAILMAELSDKLPSDVRNLTREEEKTVVDSIYKDLGVKVVAEMDNKRLNRTYGVIGGEQHLYRYPGDSLEAHSKDAADWAMFGPAGIAPGLGAWGYFTPSKQAFTKEDEMRERYYLAVETFLSPGFSERVREYRDFYKFRKMLVVNPKTGQAVVAVIGDAGPAQWTGKHLGGSPEVMHELGLAKGSRKGPVLYFFVDDPENKIPLGPVKAEG